MSGILLLSRLDLDSIYPPFLEKVIGVVSDCQTKGAAYFAISGLRTYAEQTKLYEQGRTKPGPKVTSARAGESAHNFGIAMDFCRDGVLDRAGLQPDYRPESYAELGAAAHERGLVWGGSWQFKDYPHVQWPGFVTAAQLEPLRQQYEAGGLSAVWRFLDGGANG